MLFETNNETFFSLARDSSDLHASCVFDKLGIPNKKSKLFLIDLRCFWLIRERVKTLKNIFKRASAGDATKFPIAELLVTLVSVSF